MPMPQPRSGKPKATDNPSRVAATECSPRLKRWVILNRVDLLSAGQLGATPSARRLRGPLPTLMAQASWRAGQPAWYGDSFAIALRMAGA